MIGKFSSIILTLILLTTGSIVLAQQKTVSDCNLRPNPLLAAPSKVLFTEANMFKRIVIVISNPTNAPVKVGKIRLDGKDKANFALQYKDIIIVEAGGAQPDESCSGKMIPAHGSCSFRIRQLSPTPVKLSAKIRIPVGDCDLVIAVSESQ